MGKGHKRTKDKLERRQKERSQESQREKMKEHIESGKCKDPHCRICARSDDIYGAGPAGTVADYRHLFKRRPLKHH